MHDDSFSYKRHKEIVRHTQSESAKCYQASPDQTFVACGTAKRYFSGYIVSQNRSMETYVYIHTNPNRSIASHTKKVGNAIKGFTDFSLKADVESNKALLVRPYILV